MNMLLMKTYMLVKFFFYYSGRRYAEFIIVVVSQERVRTGVCRWGTKDTSTPTGMFYFFD